MSFDAKEPTANHPEFFFDANNRTAICVDRLTHLFDFLWRLYETLVDVEAEVAHEHLVEELGEQRHLERVLLVVVGPVVEQHAQRHRRAVELAAFSCAGWVHEDRRAARQCVASLTHGALAVFFALLLVVLTTQCTHA